MGAKSSKPANANVFFEIAIDDKTIGRVVIALNDAVVPKTAQNFRELCTGQNGYGFAESKVNIRY